MLHLNWRAFGRNRAPRPAGRRLATGAGALVALSLAIGLPAQAQASATGCTQIWAPPHSCVKVVGTGTHVATVTPGVSLRARQSVRGFFHVTGSAFDFNTRVGTYWNQSWWGSTEWGQSVRINKHLRKGSKVCVAFHESNGPNHSPACVNIG